jgi:uncharacterized cupin superfamily protein
VVVDGTAGRSNWFYGVDETVYLLAGSITVVEATGQVNHLKSGDTFFFPKGTRFEWTVPTYVRKIAFIHVRQAALHRATRHRRLIIRADVSRT